jgi:type VI secretion system protein VasI
MKSAILLVAVASALPAWGAVSDQSIAACATITDKTARLACFDGVAKQVTLAVSQTPAPSQKSTPPESDDHPPAVSQPDGSPGKWRTEKSTNVLDDSTTVVLLLTADQGASKFGDKITLVARCQSNKTETYIRWGEYIAEAPSVVTRVDSGNALPRYWDVSADNKSTFHRNPIDFLKSLLGSERLVAQMAPYNENPRTAVFDTKGLDAAIYPLRVACSW